MVQILLRNYDLLVEELFVYSWEFLPTISTHRVKDRLLRDWKDLLFLAKHRFVVRVACFRLFEDCLRILLKLLHQLHILRCKSWRLIHSDILHIIANTFGLLLGNISSYLCLFSGALILVKKWKVLLYATITFLHFGLRSSPFCKNR